MIASLPAGMLAPLARLAGADGPIASGAGSTAAVDAGRAWEVRHVDHTGAHVDHTGGQVDHTGGQLDHKLSLIHI
eukprot:828056-Prorocentrum_minimum.AAC.1